MVSKTRNVGTVRKVIFKRGNYITGFIYSSAVWYYKEKLETTITKENLFGSQFWRFMFKKGVLIYVVFGEGVASL